MTGFEKLENSLIDVIKEEQAKLGFKEEKIHLYYPLSSLNHFFLAQDSADEMAARLQNLPEKLTSKLGEVRVSHKGDRFCFYIPEPGSVYVHENMKENEFIKVLLDLFASYWEKTESQEMDNGEFDFYIRFLDKADDTYYYCFKDEGFHFIYHRFLPEDYEDFGF